MSNAIVIGIQADWAINHIGVKQPSSFDVLEQFFKVVFTLELVLHILDEGLHFYARTNRNLAWNTFDTFVVASSWVEDIINLLFASSADVSALRGIRIVRLVRILRVVRVMRFFKELRAMVQGIIASLRPLVWCLVLLLLVMFTFGILILQIATQKIVESPDDDYDDLYTAFGGIMRTVYTLYNTITGGMDWGDAAELLIMIHPVMGLVFSLYIAFAVLCMLNIVTGVFVENANQITGGDTDNMVLEEMNARQKIQGEIRIMFHRATGQSSEEVRLNQRQFVDFAQDAVIQAYFRKHGLDIENDAASELFRLIDRDDDGCVTADEFVDGCSRFIGAPRRLDITRLRREHEMMRQQVVQLATLMQRNLIYSKTPEPEEAV